MGTQAELSSAWAKKGAIMLNREPNEKRNRRADQDETADDSEM